MKEAYECLFCITNHGFADVVMEAAKQAGARGGTIFSAHGTGSKDIEQFFGITVTPEKDVVLILVPKDIRDKVMMAVNEGAGMTTKGMGIVFSLPVSDTVGLAPIVTEKIDNTETQ